MSVSVTGHTTAVSTSINGSTRTFYVPSSWRGGGGGAAAAAHYGRSPTDRGLSMRSLSSHGSIRSPPVARSSTPAVATMASPVRHAHGLPMTTSRLPTEMPRDPRLWSRDDVHRWLLWCQEEFDLPALDVTQFPMNGKAMCLLMKSDFNDRAPRAGDVLYNAVHLLLLQVSVNDESQRQIYEQQLRMYTQSGGNVICSGNADGSFTNGSISSTWPFVSSDYQSMGQVINQPSYGFRTGNRLESTVTLSPAPSTDSLSSSPRQLDDVVVGSCLAKTKNDHSMAEVDDGRLHDSLNPSESGGSECGSPPPVPSVLCLTKNKQILDTSDVLPKCNNRLPLEQPVTNGRLLWDFLHQLLNDPAQRYSRCIAWKEHESGVFKIVDPNGLAQLWGMQKNHLNMNFDKMSRALRYYYRVNILKKVQGERHCYQFLRQPTELKACKQRALLNKHTNEIQNKQPDQDNNSKVHIKCEGD